MNLTFQEFALVFGISDVLNSSGAKTGTISDMYIIWASVDQTPFANSKKWGVSQADIDDWGANWTVGFSPYFEGNPKLLHEVGKSIEVVYYNSDWLNELGLQEP